MLYIVRAEVSKQVKQPGTNDWQLQTKTTFPISGTLYRTSDPQILWQKRALREQGDMKPKIPQMEHESKIDTTKS